MNDIKYISIKQKDGYKIKVSYLSCPREPIASILVLHGMAEHQKRYYAIGKYLMDRGYDLYFYDHRGHGMDNKLSDLGFIAPEKGYQLLVEDVITVSDYIIENNRSNKLFLFGHSMGSLVARNVLPYYSKYNGVILSGTSLPSKILLSIGLMQASFIKKTKGPKHKSNYLNNLLFGSKKYTKLTSRTKYDWLSRSNPVIGAYIHDPYCGFVCSASFYHDLFKLAHIASKRKQMKLIEKNLPFLILSGDKDPVGGYGREIKKLSSIYRKIGIASVTTKLYPDSRHEVINELNKDEVYSDIEQWLSQNI